MIRLLCISSFFHSPNDAALLVNISSFLILLSMSVTLKQAQYTSNFFERNSMEFSVRIPNFTQLNLHFNFSLLLSNKNKYHKVYHSFTAWILGVISSQTPDSFMMILWWKFNGKFREEKLSLCLDEKTILFI